MSKKLKYCSSCEEGFAERFVFCPDCGAALETVELNPVLADTSAESDIAADDAKATPAAFGRSWNANSLVSDGPAPAFKFPELKATDGSVPPLKLPQVKEEDFGVTVINDRNSRAKNGLLLGSTTFVVIALFSITVYSMFLKPYDIGSIGGNDIFALIPEIEPDPVEIEPEKKDKDKDEGGGSGKEDPRPVAKGTLPNMIRRPDVLPSSDMRRLTDPEVTQRVGIEGNKRLADFDQRYGLPNGSEDGGDGPGIGGSIGTGRDKGVGPGDGPGIGPGNKPGIGGNEREDNPPGEITKLTVPLKIISKPKAQYTAEAREKMVMGSVTLKITFLASGEIGTITAITRLPFGLTENAIAAAKLIKFEPKMVNGKAVPVTMTFEYGFNIF